MNCHYKIIIWIWFGIGGAVSIYGIHTIIYAIGNRGYEGIGIIVGSIMLGFGVVSVSGSIGLLQTAKWAKGIILIFPTFLIIFSCFLLQLLYSNWSTIIPHNNLVATIILASVFVLLTSFSIYTYWVICENRQKNL